MAAKKLKVRIENIQRPRVRAAKKEVPLPTFRAMANSDPLNRRIVEQMDLQRNIALQVGVVGEIDLSHAAYANE